MGRRTTSGTKIKKKNRPPKKKNSRVLEQINHNAAGIDAGAEFHYVAVPEDRASPSGRTFRTTTAGLYELADWLVEMGIDTVAVEATGVYCMPLLEVLEARGLRVLLAKPSSLKSVNDHQKTDMGDCQWIQLLHTFGLLRGSHRPTKMVAAYRVYNRQRQMLIQQASTAIEHIKKALTSMNVRVELAVSDVTGKTGMAIIRAILKGERDPQELAKLRDQRCAKSEAAIAEALMGKYSDEHLFELKQAVRTWDHFQTLIAECNEQLEQQAQMFDKKADRKDIPRARRVEHVRKNVLAFDARSLFYELLGQDLTQIDGISTGTVSVFLAEVGTNVDAFATVEKFASWLRLCPGSNTTGGKNRSGKNRSTTNRLTTALRIAAQTLNRSKSALGAFYRRKRAQIGEEKAITAAAHRLARMIYFTLKCQRPYVDPGPDHYTEQHRDRLLKAMEKRAKQFGYQLIKAA
jgi:transposase